MRRIVLLVATLFLAASACGGDEDAQTGPTAVTGATAATGATGATTEATGATGATAGVDADCVDLSTSGATFTITIRDFAFDPSCFTASASQGITVVNRDGVDHTFTMIDTGVNVRVPAGQEFNGEPIAGAVEPGTYDLVCTIHPTMTGQVTVAP